MWSANTLLASLAVGTLTVLIPPPPSISSLAPSLTLPIMCKHFSEKFIPFCTYACPAMIPLVVCGPLLAKDYYTRLDFYFDIYHGPYVQASGTCTTEESNRSIENQQLATSWLSSPKIYIIENCHTFLSGIQNVQFI